jgi:nicotinate phosphoribosyltransferase
MIEADKEDPPEVGKPVLCRNPFEELDRVQVTPSKVMPLHRLYFDGGKTSTVGNTVTSLQETKDFVLEQLQNPAPRLLHYHDPKPYPVMVSDALYKFLHDMWLDQLHVKELS